MNLLSSMCIQVCFILLNSPLPMHLLHCFDNIDLRRWALFGTAWIGHSFQCLCRSCVVTSSIIALRNCALSGSLSAWCRCMVSPTWLTNKMGLSISISSSVGSLCTGSHVLPLWSSSVHEVNFPGLWYVHNFHTFWM